MAKQMMIPIRPFPFVSYLQAWKFLFAVGLIWCPEMMILQDPILGEGIQECNDQNDESS